MTGSDTDADGTGEEALYLYRYNSVSRVLSASVTAEVNPDLGRTTVLSTLITRFNEGLTGRHIESRGITSENGRDVLTVDLVDAGDRLAHARWQNAMQGSAGGAETQITLVATLLQPRYPGRWFEAVRFLLNGEPMAGPDSLQ